MNYKKKKKELEKEYEEIKAELTKIEGELNARKQIWHTKLGRMAALEAQFQLLEDLEKEQNKGRN